MDLALQVLNIISLVVTTAIAALVVLAPVTKSDKDNRILDALRWLQGLLVKLLPTSTQLRK